MTQLCNALHNLIPSKRITCVMIFISSGTGIRKISHRFMSQIVYYCFPDYSFLRFSIYFLSSLKKRSYYTVSQSKVQCSMEIVFHLVMIMKCFLVTLGHAMSRSRHYSPPIWHFGYSGKYEFSEKRLQQMRIYSKCLNQTFELQLIVRH